MSTSRDSRKRDRHESHRDNHVSSVTGEFTRTSRDRDGDSSSNQQRDSNWNGDGNGDGIGNTNGSANGDSDANANAIYRDEGHSDSDHSHSNSHSYGQPHSHHDNHAHISSRAARHQSPRRQDSFGAVQECIHEPLGSGPQRSVEGWVVIVTGCHEEAQEEDIRDVCAEYGQVGNININLDRRTGFCKGYALVEYKSKSEAQDAINALHGTSLLGKIVHVDWAFVGSAADDFNNRSWKKIKGR